MDTSKVKQKCEETVHRINEVEKLLNSISLIEQATCIEEIDLHLFVGGERVRTTIKGPISGHNAVELVCIFDKLKTQVQENIEKSVKEMFDGIKDWKLL